MRVPWFHVLLSISLNDYFWEWMIAPCFRQIFRVPPRSWFFPSPIVQSFDWVLFKWTKPKFWQTFCTSILHFFGWWAHYRWPLPYLALCRTILIWLLTPKALFFRFCWTLGGWFFVSMTWPFQQITVDSVIFGIVGLPSLDICLRILFIRMWMNWCSSLLWKYYRN